MPQISRSKTELLNIIIAAGKKSTTVSKDKIKPFITARDAIKGACDGKPSNAEEYVLSTAMAAINEAELNSQAGEIVRTSLHLERQKVGYERPGVKEAFNQLSSFDKSRFAGYKFELTGIDFTIHQMRAVLAIQKLLDKTKYKGNEAGRSVTQLNNPFKFEGVVPRIGFDIPEYLEAYGVNKKETSRGKLEYESSERRAAIGALFELHEKKFLLYMEKKQWRESGGKKEARYDVITTVDSLIKVIQGYEDLSEVDRNKLKSGQQLPEKLSRCVVEPSILMIYEIDSYAVFKPANYLQEIRIKLGRVSVKFYKFIDYIVNEREQKRRSRDSGPIEITIKNLARNLRMDSQIKRRMWKQIKGQIKKFCEDAKKLGWISSYKIVMGKKEDKIIIEMNQDKFKKLEQIGGGKPSKMTIDDRINQAFKEKKVS